MSIKCIRWNLASVGRKLTRSLRSVVTGTQASEVILKLIGQNL